MREDPFDTEQIAEEFLQFKKIFEDKIDLTKTTIPDIGNIEHAFMQEQGRPKEQVYEEIVNALSGCVNWLHENTMYNITPPATITSIMPRVFISLLNPNMVSDIACGKLAEMEVAIIKFFGKLTEWDEKECSGAFTFGGTSTNLYGTKIGMNKADKTIAKKGTRKIITIDSDECHSSHKTATDWLGIGVDNNIVIPTNSKGKMRLDELEEAMRKAITNNKKIGCINLSGSSTHSFFIDDIAQTKKLIEKIVEEYKLDYTPHLHVDAVIGWAFLLFKGYDFDKNPLEISEKTKKQLLRLSQQIAQLKYADSFGIDFHKTGFTPYLSSLFMLKNKEDWKVLNEGARNAQHQSFELGNYNMGKYTLETSRSSEGIVSAYANLSTMGKRGYQKIIIKLLEFANETRKLIDRSPYIKNFDEHNDSWVIMYLPSQIDGKEVFVDKLMNEAEDEEIERFNRTLEKIYKRMQADKEYHLNITSKHKVSKSGKAIKALKIYPMSPRVDKKEAKKLIEYIERHIRCT